MRKPKPKTSSVDIRKIIRAAAEAALEEPSTPDVEPKKKRRLSGRRAVLLGAGAVTAGRLLMRGRGRGVVNSLQDRLARLGVELPDKPSADPEVDEEEPVDVDQEVDDAVDQEEPEAELEEDEPTAAEDEPPEDEELEDEEPSNGGAPERQPRRQRRGR